MDDESWFLVAGTTPVGFPVCGICSSKVYWIPCPTGGWWAHFKHPEDEHDAGFIQIEDEEES
jgi:hypothetical protein